MTRLIQQRKWDTLLEASTEAFTSHSNESSEPSVVKEGQIVTIKIKILAPSGVDYKMTVKFAGPYRVLQHLSGHKFELQDLNTGELKHIHGNHIKPISSTPDSDSDPTAIGRKSEAVTDKPNSATELTGSSLLTFPIPECGGISS